ncbi:MAG: very short patch repair endonuclease [Armatimonadota bacterium]|nr:very short patch repair endonuclease [Armatimonadota bacterium]
MRSKSTRASPTQPSQGILTPEQERSRIMSLVKQAHTKPEMVVRSLLHRQGYRFRLHRRDLPGSPDIVLPKYKTIIFVHGCFWHRHPGCRKATTPKTNVDYWRTKMAENVERDERKTRDLTQLGWQVVTVWQCETEPKHIEELAIRLKQLLPVGTGG